MDLCGGNALNFKDINLLSSLHSILIVRACGLDQIYYSAMKASRLVYCVTVMHEHDVAVENSE